MKKLFIWDFDGTLVDTITDVGLCFNKALKECGFPIHNIELYQQFVGGNLETVISRLLPENAVTDKNILQVKEMYRKIYAADEKPNTVPFSKVKEVLAFLYENGVYLAINTNKAQSLTEPLCEMFFSDIPFVSIKGYLPNRPSKPSPDVVCEILKTTGISKDETIYVGDGLTDVQTAENAGIDCIFVTWGQGKPGDEKSSAVKCIVHHPKDIISYYKNSLDKY